MLDPLPGKLTKDTPLPVIVRTVNLSFEEALVPANFKQGVLTPKLKKPSLDNELFPNFRPISNLRFLSKATEKVVAARLNSYLDDNNYLHELLQSAYKQEHSTETTLVKVQNDILCSIDERKCVALLLRDLSAAFDTVDHSILLSRLRRRFGIDGKALNGYTHTLLIAVSSYVLGMDIHLEETYVLYGVPQGSVLGPILYLLYTAPLADVIKEHNMSSFLRGRYANLYVLPALQLHRHS